MKSTIFIQLFFVFGLISCNDNQVFDEYITLKNNWTKKDKVEFNLPPLSSKPKYNMYVNLRSNNDYPFNNIFLIVKLEQPNKKVLVDTLEYQMAFADGSLMGNGFSDIKESKLVYKENFIFNQKGKYKVIIQHALRQTGNPKGIEKLLGISEVGFRIEKKNKN